MFECCVCLECVEKEQLKIIECNHKICNPCFGKMMKNELYSCPICRHPMCEIKRPEQVMYEQLEEELEIYLHDDDDDEEDTDTLYSSDEGEIDYPEEPEYEEEDYDY